MPLMFYHNLEMIMGVISKEYRTSLDLLIDDIAMLEINKLDTSM
jgi:hypothetical protein